MLLERYCQVALVRGVLIMHKDCRGSGLESCQPVHPENGLEKDPTLPRRKTAAPRLTKPILHYGK